MRIRPLQTGEAGTLRAVRLQAVEDAPHAFGQTRFEAANLPLSHWERAVKTHTDGQSGVVFFAGAENTPPIGLISVRRDTFVSTDAHIGQLWVAPEWRRAGTGGALVGAALYWAKRQKVGRLLTWTPQDSAALRLFRRVGFTISGRQFPQPGNPQLMLCELVCVLTSAETALPTEAISDAREPIAA